MALCTRHLTAALLLCSAGVFAQQTNPNNTAPIIQPGAPGTKGKKVSAATAASTAKGPSKADVDFMQGMIMHHSQAVEMTELLRTRTQTPALQSLGQRISISQSDEIKFMKQWLTERGKPTTMAMDHDMAGMEDMMDHMMMPGMLTPKQMKELAAAKGTQFDYLFLTGMIQHHTGALIMVEDLFDTPTAGQDPILFDFATDIDNTQRAEIRIMQSLLDAQKEKK